jgi:coatomer subunit beta
MLIHAIHTCAVKFPDVANSVVNLLMDFLSAEGAVDVIRFVREIVETYDTLRDSVLNKLISMLPIISDSDVIRSTLWILGEYSSDAQAAQVVETIKALIGEWLYDYIVFSSKIEALY